MNISKSLKSLIVCTILFASSFVSAQQLIQPEEITPKFLKETFEAAFIDIEEVGDTYIKIKDTYSIFIDIDSKKRYVTLSGIYRIVDGAKKEKVMDLMNKINGEVALVKVVYSEKSNNMGYYYYFFTEGGFTKIASVSFGYAFLISLAPFTSTSKMICFPSLQIRSTSLLNVP